MQHTAGQKQKRAYSKFFCHSRLTNRQTDTDRQTDRKTGRERERERLSLFGHWGAVQMREDLLADATALKRTSLQRCFEIVTFRDRMAKISGECMSTLQLQQVYHRNIKVATTSEPVTDTFIEQAERCRKHVLPIPEVIAAKLINSAPTAIRIPAQLGTCSLVFVLSTAPRLM